MRKNFLFPKRIRPDRPSPEGASGPRSTAVPFSEQWAEQAGAAWRRGWRNGALTGGLALFSLFLILALSAPFLAPYDPNALVGAPLEPPSGDHLLGTNDIGQDILSEWLYGARLSLFIALATGFGAAAIGLFLGVVAGYQEGALDRFISRLVDFFLVIPDLPLIILLAVFLRPRLTNVVLVLIFLSWPMGTRILRAQTAVLKKRPHVEAARLFGFGPFYLISRHLLPELLPLFISLVALQAAHGLTTEAGLAFLGLGDPTAKSWGMMIRHALSYRGIYLTRTWLWWLLPPGFSIALLVLAFSLIGQSLEKWAHPHLRRAEAAVPRKSPEKPVARPQSSGLPGETQVAVKDVSVRVVSASRGLERAAKASEPAAQAPVAPEPSAGALLRLDDLTLCYPNSPEPALRGINLTLFPGERVGIVGGSGSGKTSLLSSLLGGLPPGSKLFGRIYWEDKLLWGEGDRGKDSRPAPNVWLYRGHGNAVSAASDHNLGTSPIVSPNHGHISAVAATGAHNPGTSANVWSSGSRGEDSHSSPMRVSPEWLSLRWRKIALVPQAAMNGFNPVLTIEAQIMETILIHEKVTREAARVRTRELLAQVGLDPRWATRYPHQLSGGMKQRAMLALALCLNPTLVLLDEPTSALDWPTQEVILSLIEGLQKKRGFALLVVSHELPVVARLSQRLLVLSGGQIVEEGAVSDLFQGAAHPFTRSLLETFAAFYGPTPGNEFFRQTQSQPGRPLPGDQLPGSPLLGSELQLGPSPWVGPHPQSQIRLAPASRLEPKSLDQSSSRIPLPSAPARNGHDLLVLENVSKSFSWPGGKRRVLDNINLRLAAGDFVTLMGPSGSGKTTLLRLILGLGRADAGVILFQGEPLGNTRSRHFLAQVQYIQQDPYQSLNPRWPVKRLVVEPLLAQSYPSLSPDRDTSSPRLDQARMKQVLAVLEQVGLTPVRSFLDRLPSELSGGQRQRVALARALITNPRLLLADEPLSMLDFNLRRQLLDLLLKLHAERGLAVLFVTHDPGLARYAAQPILYLEKGRLQPQSPPLSFLALDTLLAPASGGLASPSPLAFK